jgi:Domain of unknown function (DUF2703)
MKRILIEWLCYDGKAPSLCSSAQVEELAERVVQTLRPFLRTMQIQLDLRPVEVTADDMDLSGTVRINGKKIEACSDEKLSLETLTDAILKETARFARGCAGNPEDLQR